MSRRRREPSPDRALRGTPGAPGDWHPSERGARVALHQPGFADADASYVYAETGYADAPGQPRAPGGRRGRPSAGAPAPVAGPLLHPPVWTWEVPAYFWLGGTAAGAAFAGLALRPRRRAPRRGRRAAREPRRGRSRAPRC